MRIVHVLAFSAALAALTGPVAVCADATHKTKNGLDLDNEKKDGAHDFDRLDQASKGRDKGNATAQGGFALRGAGGRLRLCPTGDCKASIIDVSMHHLQELDGTTVTDNKVANFDSASYTWTTPATALNTDGVNVTTSSFTASLPVGSTTVTYKAEVGFYATNGTAKNGDQIIDVPAGGLKFAVWIENWPFLKETNTLHLGLHVVSKNKKGDTTPKGEKKTGQGRDKKIDRVELLDSMFLDSPSLAQVDGTMTTITTSAKADADMGVVIIDYAFPKFTKLYYDPVVSSGDSTPTDSTSSLRSLAPAQSQASITVGIAALMLSVLTLVTF